MAVLIKIKIFLRIFKMINKTTNVSINKWVEGKDRPIIHSIKLSYHDIEIKRNKKYNIKNLYDDILALIWFFLLIYFLFAFTKFIIFLIK